MRGPPECHNCGHDPSGNDDEFTSGGGWEFSNSVGGGVWRDELHCPICGELVWMDEKDMEVR